MSANETLAALKQVIAAAGLSDPRDTLGKATFSQPGSPTTGLQDYDLSAAVLNLYPVLTPLRNMIPRVGNGFSTQANWKAVTAIDTGRVFAGVSEGHRGSVTGVQTKEYFAAYRTLGVEANVTDEAMLAAADFDDVRARAANSGLQSLMLAEEQVILGGNTSTALGTTPTPTLSTATTGGAIGTSVAVSVICVALTFEGRQRADMITGVKAQVTRTTADGYTETIGGGSATKSANATITTNSSSSANTVTANVVPVRGAYGYAWFAGTAGSETLQAITGVSQIVLTSIISGVQTAASLPGGTDSSCNSLVHDGLLTMAGNSNYGAYYQAVPAGQGLTADGSGGIVEFDAVLQNYWDTLRLSPGSIHVASQEANWIRKKILTAGASSGHRFTFNVQQNAIVGGGMAKGYLNPFAMSGGPTEIPISIHPNMPAGTVLFLTHELPYQANNVDNILQIKTRKDYYQTDWPRRTRMYECGVYTDQVLQNKFMPGMAVLTNLSPN